MTQNRWTLAIEAGEIDPPKSPVLVVHARGDADYSDLQEPTCIQGFRPDFDRLHARGLTVTTEPEGQFASALVQIVKSKAATLSGVAEALGHVPEGGLLMVDGQKELGIEGIAKQLRLMFEIEGVMSKAHGKLVWFRRPKDIPGPVLDWIAAPQEVEGGYMTAPGGFSTDGPDRGSEILVAIAPAVQGRVADWGAGWGYIAGEILAEQDGIETLDLVEADHAMLEAAQINVDDPRARFHWADATRFMPEAPYDAILSNPPFHQGRRADPDLGRAFIASAARNLTPKGRFYMVANRHLPYEDTLKAHFGTGRLLGELEGYKIYEAAKPVQGKRR